MKTIRAILVLSTVLLLLAPCAMAQITLPHDFVPGTPARAAEVNANFQAIVDAANSESARLDHFFGLNAKRFVVSQAEGDFQSIQAAIDAVPAGEAFVIDILPGVYTENLTLKAGIHLRGAGREITTVTAASPTLPTVLVDNVANVAISGLTITGGSPGLRNINASPRVTLCSVSSNITHGIHNEPLASPLLIDNLINNNGNPDLNNGSGVLNVLTSNPSMFNNILSTNSRHGIENHASDPQLHSNRILNNLENGVDNEESSPTLLGNRVSGNGVGIKNFNASTATIVGNRISDNETVAGIWNNASSPHIIGNRITLNGVGEDLQFVALVDGIRNEAASSPTVVGNRITQNGQHGVFNQNGSNASLTGNRISDNFRGDGIHIDNSVVHAGNNRITANGLDNGAGAGVEIINIPAGRSMILHNRINGNALADVIVDTSPAGSEPNISFNIYDVINGAANAVGAFNLTSAALIIAPNTPGVATTP